MVSFLKSKQLYRTLAVYLGSSWVLIEAGNYFVSRYQYPDYYIDVLIILLIFGLLSFLYNAWVETSGKKSALKSLNLWPHVVNGIVALSVAYYVFDNAKTDYIKFKSNESRLVSIAVLPFENIGPDSTYYWMGDAICSELINYLDNVESIDVKSKSASFYFKNKNYNSVQIADLLGINKMLDGNIMVLDSMFKINVNLVNPLTGSQLWNETFEGKISDVFELQSEIAVKVTEKININLTTEEKSIINAQVTDSKEAYELFVKGKYHYNLLTPTDIRRANEYFAKAVQIDPDFISAYAYLALTYNMFGGIYLGLFPDSAYQVVDQLVDKIYAIDKDNLMGKFLEASVTYFYDRDYNRGLQIATAAYNEMTSKEDVIWPYVIMLSMNRQADKSIEIIEEYIANNPTSAPAYQGLCQAIVILNGRDTNMPIEYFNEPCFKCQELDPNFSYSNYYLAELHFMRREYEKSIEYWQLMADVNPYAMFYEGLMRATFYTGDTTKAMNYFNQVRAQYSLGYAMPIVMARSYATLNEIDSAAKYLEMAYSMRDIEMVALWNEPAFDPIRDEPKFKEILNRMQNAGPVAGSQIGSE